MLINNAGVGAFGPVEELSMETIARDMETNYFGTVRCIKAVLPAMRLRKSGCIINISSMAAQYGLPKVIAYSASKTAIDGITRAMAVELSPKGIRVNAVVVAESWTPAYEKWIKTLSNPGEKLKTITDKIPFENRMTTPEEIANMVAFLLSERSSHTTGQIIHVDGGYVHLDRALL